MHRHPMLGSVPPQPPTPQFSVIQALAGLAQVIVAVAAYLQLNTPRAWWILALGATLLALTFGRPLVRRVSGWRRRRQDDRTARRNLAELRSLIRAFGKLVDPNTNDTLQAGLQEAFKTYANVLEHLHVPSVHLFDEMLHNLTMRLEEEPTDAGHLLRALAELYTVVTAHSAQCIQPVFRAMPPSVSERLTPTARGVLNSYRERYVAFHAAFGKFTEDLAASFRVSKLHSTYYVFRPDALT